MADSRERIEALKAQIEPFRFDPNQKRDGDGKWSDGVDKIGKDWAKAERDAADLAKKDGGKKLSEGMRKANGPSGPLDGDSGGGKVLAKPSDWLTHVKKSRKPGTPVAVSDDGHARLVESDDNAGSHDPNHRDLRLETRNSADGPWKSTGQYFPKDTISRKRHVLDDYTPGALWKAAGDDEDPTDVVK